MFRNPEEELTDLIATVEQLSPANADQFKPSNTLEKDLKTARDFLRNEIEIFATDMIENMIELKLVNVEFCAKLFQFDHELYENVLKTSIEKLFDELDLNDVLNFVARCSKCFQQAIMGYEIIYNQIKDYPIWSEEYFALSKKLYNMRKMPLFSELSEDQKARAMNMSKYLPLYPEDLPETSEVFIISVGTVTNNEIPNSETHKRIRWTVYHDRAEKIFEFTKKTGVERCVEGLLIGMETPGLRKRLETPAKFAVQLELHDKDDVSKGYTIRIVDSGLYFGVVKNGYQSALLSKAEMKQRDDVVFTWIFATYVSENQQNIQNTVEILSDSK